LRGVPKRDGVTVLASEYVLGVVEPRPREPLGTGHLPARENSLRRLAEAHLEELRDRLPELLELGGRPAPQLLVRAKAQSTGPLEPLLIAGQGGPFDPVGRGLPEKLG